MAKTKRPHGDGSISRKGTAVDGTPIWSIKVSNDRDPITGKRDRRARNVKGTLSDARKALDELKQEMQYGIIKNADDETFFSFSKAWLDARETSGMVSQATIDSNTHSISVLNEYISSCKVKDITPVIVDRLYSQIRKDKHYANGTLHHIHVTLNMIMKRAVNLGYIVSNPCDRVEKPKRGKSNRNSLTSEQAAHLRKVITEAANKELDDFKSKEQRMCKLDKTNDREYIRDVRPVSCVIAALIGLATGARRGEVLALTWGDVNLKSGVLRIGKTITQKLEIKEPKTAAGIRSIAIDSGTVEMLKRWKLEQQAMLSVFNVGIIQSGNTPVCINSLGNHIEPHNFSKWWRKFCIQNKLGGLKFHELRHTQATLLLISGTDIKTVQTRLGHKSASVTLDMYAHAMPETDREAADTMGDIFAADYNTDKIVKIA